MKFLSYLKRDRIDKILDLLIFQLSWDHPLDANFHQTLFFSETTIIFQLPTTKNYHDNVVNALRA